ncbi:MAG: HEAT repeat domain-containing protein [Deltaproteobacteria bacterium]|nr:HEAT repeat domain-containing protein [Deltaproteobacteria bacterium]
MLLKNVAKTFDLSLVRARSLLRAALFHAILVSGITTVKSATNALYLARRDPRDLPYLYLATAAVVALVTFYLARRLSSLSAKPVLRNGLLVVGALLLLLSSLAALDVRASLGVLYVMGEAYATALSVLFWARLGEVFDVRAAKRVFGLVAAAGMAGAMAGGLMVKAFAGVVPSVAWCFFGAVSLLLARPLLGSERTPGSVRRERVPMREGLRYASTELFPLAVAGLVLLLSAQSAAVDFVFRTESHRFLAGDEAAMAALFGLLNAIVGALAILFQTVLTGRVLGRLGVFAYLSIVPVGGVLAAVWSLASPSIFAPFFVLKTVEMMGSFSLYQPALQLFFNPIPSSVRGSVRALIDGAVKKVGGAVGGLVLLLVGSALGTNQLLLLVIGIALAVLLAIRVLRPLYLSALERKLGGKGPAKIPVIDAGERSTRQQLLRALKEGDASKALAAVSVLEGERNFDFRPVVESLISHPVELVRLKAIELVTRAPDRAYVPFLISVVKAEGRHGRATAARALMLIDPITAREVLEPVLADAANTADPSLVTAALVALLGSGVKLDPAAAARAESALARVLQQATSGSSQDRRELAWMLGMLGPGRYAAHLAALIDDPSQAVRAAAIEAAARAPDPALPPRLVALLGERTLLPAVRTALAAHGDAVVPLLAQVLDDRRIDVQTRVQIPRILRQIGTSAAVNAMLYSNQADDAYLRYVIIEELGRVRRRHPELAFDRPYTEQAVLRRLRAYVYYRPVAEDLGAAGAAYALLYRALQDRVRQNLEAALRLLGLLYDPRMMENAFVGLSRGGRVSRGDAIEIVDVAVQGSDVRTEILSLIEPGPPPAIGERARDRALSLIEGRDTRLALIAHETLLRLGEIPPEVREPTTGEPLMPKSILERVFLLQNVQLFRGLSVDDLSAVAAITTDGHAEPRQVVYEEGQLGDSMYVITSGDIHLLRGGQSLLDLHAGDSFGQTSILDGGPRPVTAKAGDEGADFVRLERQPFMDLMADRPELMNGLFVELAARIRELIKLSQTEGSPAVGAASAGAERSSPPARAGSSTTHR